ncbi:hypothetical protein [Bradyrhizobium nitroreducens]|nr:hypothetical protein [Bradyrhizobium nitroreducens]
MNDVAIGAIELTPEESQILEEMILRQELLFGDHSLAECNGELSLALMRSLLQRKAIPKVRLKYFEEPSFRTGRIKGSYRSLFERNKTTGDDIYRHPNFLRHLRYFINGTELPKEAIKIFAQKAHSCGHVGPSDALELGTLARDLTRKFGLSIDTELAAEEFYKLALDCGIYQGHAAVVRDRVKAMK